MINLKFLRLKRPALAHVLPNMTVGAVYEFMLDLMTGMPDYDHYWVVRNPGLLINREPALIVQPKADVLYVDELTPEFLNDRFTGAIYYGNVCVPQNIGQAIPSLFYAYGSHQHEHINAAVTIAASEYSKTHFLISQPDGCALVTDYVIPPALNTRPLRQLKLSAHPFTVAVMNNNAFGDFPVDTATTVLRQAHNDDVVMLTDPYEDEMAWLRLEPLIKARAGHTIKCPVRPTIGLRYLIRTDVLVFDVAANLNPAHSRLLLEAAALGKAIVCTRRGVFQTLLEHNVNALLFDSTEELTEHIGRLRVDSKLRSRLGVNAQLWASHQDLSIHLSTIKGLLKAIHAG